MLQIQFFAVDAIPSLFFFLGRGFHYRPSSAARPPKNQHLCCGGGLYTARAQEMLS
jgi:hypothetical protein